MNVLVISDLHAPFNHPNAIDFLNDLNRTYKPARIVCIGDEVDAHGWSRYGKHPDAMGQADEIDDAMYILKQLYKVFPKVTVCKSNHGDRAFRAAARVGLPSKYIKTQAEVLEAPGGWKWVDGVEIDGVLYEHGEGFSGMNSAINAARVNRRNTVIGHVHAWAGIQYHANKFGTIWGMNVGCLIDPSSIAMSYAKASPNKQVLGTGLVLDGMPVFIPLKG